MDSRILTDAVLDELHGWAIEDDPRLLRAQERARANAMLEGIPNPDVAPIDLARRVLEHLLTTDRSTR